MSIEYQPSEGLLSESTYAGWQKEQRRKVKALFHGTFQNVEEAQKIAADQQKVKSHILARVISGMPAACRRASTFMAPMFAGGTRNSVYHACCMRPRTKTEKRPKTAKTLKLSHS